jgi:hypothetical protein
MKHKYQPSGLHRPKRLKEHVRMHLNTIDLSRAEWQRVLQMEIQLCILDELRAIRKQCEEHFRNAQTSP